MTDPLEAELDRLFRLPLADFVEARDALVLTLKKAGDKAGAARVKMLRRPSVAAWALNQLFFEAPTLLARAQQAHGEVRALHAQDGVDARVLSGPLTSQRAVLHEVVEAASKRCDAAGLPTGAGPQKKLLSTLQAVLAGASEEPFGRLFRDLEPGGFDAIAVVGASSPGPRPGVVATPATIKAEPAPDTERLSAARARLRELELQAHDARKRAQDGQREAAQAEREQASALARVREAEQALGALRARLATREQELERAQAELATARAQEDEIRKALEEARAQIASAR